MGTSEAVESTEKTWDVIFTGFAIHHLMPEEKARFFHAAGRCLSEKGWLVMVDVVREENQDRESYLDGYLRFMREKWTAGATGSVGGSLCTCPGPRLPRMPLQPCRTWPEEAGLNSTRLISRHAQHHTLLFSRSAPPGRLKVRLLPTLMLHRLTLLFPLWMILSGAAALCWPERFMAMNQGSVVVLVLAFIMLCMGLTLTLEDFRRIARMPRAVAIGFAAQYSIMPLLAWGVAKR